MTLVSIVGDFYSSVLPIFYEFKERIKTHIVIYDDFKNDVVHARKIISGTTNFVKKNKLNIKTYSVKIDEDSLEAIHKLAKIIENYVSSDDKLYINVTDGLANVGIVLSNIYLERGANIITYDRYDNSYNILSKEQMQTHKVEKSTPIREHFLLKNIEITNTQDMSPAKKYEHQLNLFFEKYEGDRALYIEHEQSDKYFLRMPTGFLYEYYIYNLIKKLNYDDILLGAKIKDQHNDDMHIENEYDILIMKDNHLHMIECKYLKELDVTQLIYKVDSVRASLDEDANIMIVSDGDTYDETKLLGVPQWPSNHTRALVKRVYLRGSPTKNSQEFVQEVDRIFELKTQNIEQINKDKKSYSSIKEPMRAKLKHELNGFLSNKLNLQVNYFDKKEIGLLINYKTYYKEFSKITNSMQDEKIHQLVSLINKMLNSKKEYVSIEIVYEYYEINLKIVAAK